VTAAVFPDLPGKGRLLKNWRKFLQPQTPPPIMGQVIFPQPAVGLFLTGGLRTANQTNSDFFVQKFLTSGLHGGKGRSQPTKS
jgi:hypothetical protein